MICDICGHPYDCEDYNGRYAHVDKIMFPDLSEEISEQIRGYRSKRIYEDLTYKSPNAKCSFIKKAQKFIIETEKKIKLIQAILDGKIIYCRQQEEEINKQIEKLGLDIFEFRKLRLYDLSEEKIVELQDEITRKKNDIEIIKQIQPLI